MRWILTLQCDLKKYGENHDPKFPAGHFDNDG